MKNESVSEIMTSSVITIDKNKNDLRDVKKIFRKTKKSCLYMQSKLCEQFLLCHNIQNKLFTGTFLFHLMLNQENQRIRIVGNKFYNA